MLIISKLILTSKMNSPPTCDSIFMFFSYFFLFTKKH
uniref:Uncharacterized protein n=1 Tax=Arundo donax TaxID=35708 RepID=A0A0A8Z9J8_ARUDO